MAQTEKAPILTYHHRNQAIKNYAKSRGYTLDYCSWYCSQLVKPILEAQRDDTQAWCEKRTLSELLPEKETVEKIANSMLNFSQEYDV